jgi:hypothetical protein
MAQALAPVAATVRRAAEQHHEAPLTRSPRRHLNDWLRRHDRVTRGRQCFSLKSAATSICQRRRAVYGKCSTEYARRTMQGSFEDEDITELEPNRRPPGPLRRARSSRRCLQGWKLGSGTSSAATQGHRKRAGAVDPAFVILTRVTCNVRPVVPENPIRADSRDDGESGHHPVRCLRSSSCSARLSATCSSRGADLKSRTSFSGISSISP